MSLALNEVGQLRKREQVQIRRDVRENGGGRKTVIVGSCGIQGDVGGVVANNRLEYRLQAGEGGNEEAFNAILCYRDTTFTHDQIAWTLPFALVREWLKPEAETFDRLVGEFLQTHETGGCKH